MRPLLGVKEKMSLPNTSKDEFLKAISNGVKEAVLTMTESGDGYSGMIIREPFLNAVKEGVKESMISEDQFERFTDKIEFLAEMVDELGKEIYKYRKLNQ